MSAALGRIGDVRSGLTSEDRHRIMSTSFRSLAIMSGHAGTPIGKNRPRTGMFHLFPPSTENSVHCARRFRFVTEIDRDDRFPPENPQRFLFAGNTRFHRLPGSGVPILLTVTTLSPEQIAQHAYDAGFRGEALSTAVAVAMAESSGNTEAHNGQEPDDSYGLWQINLHGDLGPGRRERFGLSSDDELLDPAKNAEAAYSIAGNGENFVPWSTYNDGTYKEHLDEAQKAAAAIEGGGDTGPSGPPGGSTEQPSGPPADSGGQDNGFTVETDLLTDYAKAVEGIAEELGNIGKRALDSVTGLAPNSFGEVGEETGFAGALADLSKSLDKQVAAVGESARSLGQAAADAAKTYLDADDESIKALEGVLKL
ncbi:hypothetical protein BJ969_001797 [Saccharopolyspora gloriosae]|uniref:Transglycosylase SLT domain-containing protein n=1 Tax=Saccharopolyspora gloriosae TaxID=455344 RepID=A0A840NHE2_9PSEU|nr:transglycosylase SLT domain-containing protein [Saccharopolyspora gloriosae]MBB5068709.1 hypothetical protein [Saccharopolyspora gloriosae]